MTAYRMRADLTLEAFAARVGTTKSWLSRIEAHLVMPSTSLIERMVRESGGELSANDFFSLPAGVAS